MDRVRRTKRRDDSDETGLFGSGFVGKGNSVLMENHRVVRGVVLFKVFFLLGGGSFGCHSWMPFLLPCIGLEVLLSSSG